jgi:SAM-dependent methyltransferase
LLEGRLPLGARVLDVGCGLGFLAAELKARGFQAEGVELSPTGARHARSLGVEVTEGTLETSGFPDGRFDAVCAYYVIEHLGIPRTFFRESHRLLRPRGWLLLRWPHTSPLVRWCRLLGIRVDLFDAPSHLTDFHPESLERLLRRTGFGEIRIWPGGSTWQRGWLPRVAGVVGGAIGDGLHAISLGRYIAPGPSKTTLARALERKPARGV